MRDTFDTSSPRNQGVSAPRARLLGSLIVRSGLCRVPAPILFGVGFLAYDEYVIPFELAAIVLTVALVAAVYIARRRRVDVQEEGAQG